MNKIGRSEPIPCVHIYPYDSFLKKKKAFSGVKKKLCWFISLRTILCGVFDVAQPISIEQHRSRYKHVLVIYTQSTVID